MKKSVFILAVIGLTMAAFFASAQVKKPTAPPDSTSWTLKLPTQGMSYILRGLDTAAVVLNNSDVPAKDRVKVVAYLSVISSEIRKQLQEQAERDKAKQVPKKD